MLSRRTFVQRTALASALFGTPVAQAEDAFGPEAPQLPPRKLRASDPDRHWGKLRRQWLLAPDRINLNSGAFGCTPVPVLRAVIDHLLAAEEYREPDYPWFGYEEKPVVRELREGLAAFLHCKRDELAIVRNTTEANNVVCNGLDMKPGDEALLTDQEHAGGSCSWEQKAHRFGIKLKVVALPKPPASTDEIVDRFAKALTPRTRIIVFSHIAYTTGLVLPARDICQLARKRGIMTQIDGAHAVGQIPLNLHDVGCDFYTNSTHKWLLAPKGTGLLYVREGMQERLWVNIATAGWRDFSLKAFRFSQFGSSNLSLVVGLKAALDFYLAIGPEHIYRRMHEMAGKVRERVSNHKKLRITNASADAFYAGMVGFEAVKGSDLKRVHQECDARHIRTGGGGDRILICTHVFTQSTELNAFFDALDRGLS